MAVNPVCGGVGGGPDPCAEPLRHGGEQAHAQDRQRGQQADDGVVEPRGRAREGLDRHATDVGVRVEDQRGDRIELAFGIEQEGAGFIPTLEQFSEQWRAAADAVAFIDPRTFEELRARDLPMRLLHDKKRKLVQFRLRRELSAGEMASATGGEAGAVRELKLVLPEFDLTSAHASIQREGSELRITLTPGPK